MEETLEQAYKRVMAENENLKRQPKPDNQFGELNNIQTQLKDLITKMPETFSRLNQTFDKVPDLENRLQDETKINGEDCSIVLTKGGSIIIKFTNKDFGETFYKQLKSGN